MGPCPGWSRVRSMAKLAHPAAISSEGGGDGQCAGAQLRCESARYAPERQQRGVCCSSRQEGGGWRVEGRKLEVEGRGGRSQSRPAGHSGDISTWRIYRSKSPTVPARPQTFKSPSVSPPGRVPSTPPGPRRNAGTGCPGGRASGRKLQFRAAALLLGRPGPRTSWAARCRGGRSRLLHAPAARPSVYALVASCGSGPPRLRPRHSGFQGAAQPTCDARGGRYTRLPPAGSRSGRGSRPAGHAASARQLGSGMDGCIIAWSPDRLTA